MTSRLVSQWLGGAWVGLVLLVGAFAGCDGRSATTSDSGVDSDCCSSGGDLGCNAGRCSQDSSAGSGGSASAQGGASGASGVPGPGGASATNGCKAAPDVTPSFPSPTALDPDLVARAAAVIGSCMPDDGVARNATHIWLEHLAAGRLYFRFGTQLDCFANAACGCEALEQCLGWTARRAPADCTGECAGGVFTGCGDETQVTLDCGRLGLGCDPEANCVTEAAVACDGSEATTCTAAGEVQFCDDGFVRQTPCRALGFSCEAGKCVGTGASCTGETDSQRELVQPFGTGCTGDSLQACLDGKAVTIDCATQGPGFSCQSVDGSFFCGLAAECVPADNYLSAQPQTCDGTVLSFCNAGRMEHLDCTTLGFTGCEIDTKVGHYGCTPGIVLP